MYRKERKIPTIIGLFLLFSTMAGLVYLDTYSTRLTSQAESGSKPTDIQFTNITDNSFTISYLTQKPVIGAIKVLDGPHLGTYLDDLDIDNTPRPKVTHYITLKNLSSNTKYSINIISGDESCKKEGSCVNLTQKTAITLDSFLDLPPARGSIVTGEKKAANQAIVYLTIGKSAPLSGRTDSSGLWVIPLNNLYTQDLLSRPEIKDDDIIQITVKYDLKTISTAVTDVKSIRQNLTIPTMILGQSYNLIDLINKKNQLAALDAQRTLGAQITRTRLPINRPPDVSKKNSSAIDILFPKKDGDFTSDTQPRIRGIAPVGSKLTIIINSSPQTGKLNVGPDGTWTFRPIKPLSPGKHKITLSGIDNKGNSINIKREFYVLKSGERVLGEATPSASITPNISPTLTATPAPSITLIPTSITTPTTSATPSPTQILATETPTAAPTAAPPRTGIINSTFLLLGGGIALFAFGLKLLVF